jgi:DNA-binding transcriptional LysR family regulator
MDLLAQMAMFVRVVETGRLSAAARALGLSVPAVSRQLRALELELNTSLIVRSTRHLRVTEAGHIWHAQCTRILRDVAEARRSVAPRGVQGNLVISASVTFGVHHVLPRLPALLRKHPALELDLRLEDSPVDLVADHVDVVLRAGLPIAESATLIARPLSEFQRIVVAAPSYLRARGVPVDPASLPAHDAIVQLSAVGPLAHWRFQRAEEQRDVSVRSRLRLSTPLAIREAAVSGLGIAWLPAWLVVAELHAGALSRLFEDWSCPPASVWALYRVEARNSPLIRAFLESMVGLGPKPQRKPGKRSG